MQNKPGFGTMTKIGGPDSEVEVDETFVGGKKRNMHKDKALRYEQKGGAQARLSLWECWTVTPDRCGRKSFPTYNAIPCKLRFWRM